MPIKLTCPHCGTVHRFSAPYPVAGAEVHCGCGHVLVLSYPPDLLSHILAQGGSLSEPDSAEESQAGVFRPTPTAPRPGARERGGAPPPSARDAGSDAPEGHR